MSVARLLVVAAVASVGFGYSNTSPIVAWSSISSFILDSLPARLDSNSHSVSLIQSIIDAVDICSYNAVVIVEQPGLHASDLRSLSPQSQLARTLLSAPSARQYPYVPAHPDFDALAFAERVSTTCRSQLTQHILGDENVAFNHDVKHVVYINMPHLTESGRARKDAMVKYQSLLHEEIALLPFSDYFIIYAGTPFPSSSNNFFKRQAPNNPDRPVLDLLEDEPVLPAYTNATLPNGGILKKYQLLTPALITSLSVFLFIMLPILFVGLKALAGVQNPIRSDVSRTFNAQERKNQ